MTVGCLPKGSYSEEVAKKERPDDEIVYLPNIAAVFKAVASRSVDEGIVPVENSKDGIIKQTLDNLPRYSGSVYVMGSAVLNIRHSLGALSHHGGIEKIISKDTALSQCFDYLEREFPDAELVDVGSTTGAMKMIADQGMLDTAAIGPKSAFAIYGLDVLAEDIGISKTRFLILGDHQSESTGRDTTSIMVHPKRNRPGLLYDMARIIKEHGLNLSLAETRPDGHGLYLFYYDIDGHFSDAAVEACISSLREDLPGLPTTDVTVFGSFPRIPLSDPLIKSIGIIGGTGKMGSLFMPFFEEQGYKVYVAGRNTALSYEECVKQSDAVLVNVPVQYTDEVIKRIGPLMTSGQLLIDNTGVKSDAVEAMLNSTSDDVEVISIHTMFGEAVKTIKKQNIISVPTKRSGKMAYEFEDMLRLYGAHIYQSTPKEHDTCATCNQSLVHTSAVAELSTIYDIIGDPDKLEPFSTPNSRNSTEIYRRVHKRDPELLGTMLRMNRYSARTLRTFANKVLEIADDVENGGSSVFEGMMAENKKRLDEQ